MGVFDFLKKKKKEDDFLDLGADLGGKEADFGPAGQPVTAPTEPGPPLPGMPTTPIAPVQPVSQDAEILKKNIETLNYKFDSVKAILDNINARLARIEAALKTPGQQQGQETEWTF